MMHRTVAFSDLKFICVNDRLRDVTLGFSGCHRNIRRRRKQSCQSRRQRTAGAVCVLCHRSFGTVANHVAAVVKQVFRVIHAFHMTAFEIDPAVTAFEFPKVISSRFHLLIVRNVDRFKQSSSLGQIRRYHGSQRKKFVAQCGYGIVGKQLHHRSLRP